MQMLHESDAIKNVFDKAGINKIPEAIET